MNEEVLILSASKYDFVDEKTNRAVKGLTVWFVPIKGVRKEDVNGLKPAKCSMPADKMNELDRVELPAFGVLNGKFDFTTSKIVPDSFSDLVEISYGQMV